MASFLKFGTPAAEVAVYLLYSFLTFTEVLVLFASAIALFIFVVRQIIGEIARLTEAAVSPSSSDLKSFFANFRSGGATVQKRAYQIRGGHNELF